MDVGQPADVVARSVAFERVSSFSVGDHRGPVRIIVIPLFVDQPKFDDGTWQWLTSGDRPHRAFELVTLADSCSDGGVGAVEGADLIVGCGLAVIAIICRLALAGNRQYQH